LRPEPTFLNIPFWNITKRNISCHRYTGNGFLMKKTIYSKEYKLITEQLKKARKQAGLDQIDIAKRLGKTQSYISKIEAGQLRLDLIQLKELAKLYNKTINYFLS
jgi:ribosome-binding protein aMBF1 (putative translation factor)